VLDSWLCFDYLTSFGCYGISQSSEFLVTQSVVCTDHYVMDDIGYPSRLEKSIPPHPVTTLYLVAIIPQCRPWWMPLWEGCVFGVHAAGGGDTVLIDMHSFDECCCCRWLVAVLAEVCWWVCHCLTSDTSEHMDRRWSGMHMDNDEEWLMIYGQMHGEWAQMYGGECDQTVPN
jgi:hypothetical protein